jgi:hypothetical protein
MKIKVQLVVCAEDGRKEQVQEVVMLEKPHQRCCQLIDPPPVQLQPGMPYSSHGDTSLN